MALPIIPVASNTIVLPLANRSVKINAWRVGDEKLLLAAAQSNTTAEIQRTFVNLIQSVVQTDVDVQTLQIADVEFAFLQIRCLSLDDTVVRRYQCQTPTGNGVCNTLITLNIPLQSAKIEPSTTIPSTLNFDTSEHIIRLSMRMPTIADSPFIPTDDQKDIDAIQPFLQRLITSITVDEEVYDPKDSTDEEWQRFFDSLQRPHLEQLEQFVQKIPRIVVRHLLECPTCGLKTELVFKGLRDLFF